MINYKEEVLKSYPNAGAAKFSMGKDKSMVDPTIVYTIMTDINKSFWDCEEEEDEDFLTEYDRKINTEDLAWEQAYNNITKK